MILVFDAAQEKLFVYRDVPISLSPVEWSAANNVQFGFKPWPPGRYRFDQQVSHADDAPDSAYGSFGSLRFIVPGRTGMEIHSGRATIPDGLQRVGFEHCTFGCIRTIDAAMKDLVLSIASDPIEWLVVVGKSAT